MLLATVFALAAAALHAGWNLRVKTSGDRFVALWGQFLAAGAVCAVGLLLTGMPERDAWPWLALSACIHVGYVAGLARAYAAGDFSLAYPLARGGGAMVAAVGGVAFLDDRLTALSYVAILVITGGLVSFVRPGTSWDSIRWALVVAVLIGCYTLADAVGARRTEGIAYVLATFVSTSIMVSAWGLATGHLTNLRRTWAVSWRAHLTSGLASAAAYGLVLFAVRWAPVGYVASLRESSVVLAAVAGWRYLAEGFGRARFASATVVVTGLVLLVVAR
jgi:drug/metabolite transporter (DMT)-like permease